MAIRVVRPSRLPRSELDRYLDEGWFRIGQTLMTCHAVLFDGALRSALWTRLELSNLRLSKSNRKLLARNGRRYRVEVGHPEIDSDHEGLYGRYREVVRGERSPTLEDFLFGGSERDLFETREVRIFDGDRLVAFSWFDLGVQSIQSLAGFYEPSYARHSLGYFTMLQEIQYGVSEGLSWFYPGYVLPGEPAMDYKLRVGAVEYRDPSRQRWQPWGDLEVDELPVARIRGALHDAKKALGERNIDSRVHLYSMFEAPAWHDHLRGCLDQPLVLECEPQRRLSRPLIIAHDLDNGTYRLLRCVRARALTMAFEGAEPRPVELWVVDAWLATCRTPESVAEEAERWRR